MSTTHEHTRAHQEQQRFAVAVERAGLATETDRQFCREVDLVTALHEARAVLTPSADASARMRARVMAGAARMMTEHCEVGPFIPEVGTSGEATPSRRGQADVIPLRGVRGRHRRPATAPTAGAGLGKRGMLTLSAAAAVTVLAVTGAGALWGPGAPSGDSLSPVTRTTDTVTGRAPSDGGRKPLATHEHGRSLAAAQTSRPARHRPSVASTARDTSGDTRPSDITHSRQSSRSDEHASHHRTSSGSPRMDTGSMLAGLPGVADGSHSDTLTGISGRSRSADPSAAMPNLGLSH